MTSSLATQERGSARTFELARDLFLSSLRTEGLRLADSEDVARMASKSIEAARQFASIADGVVPLAVPPAKPDPSSAGVLSPEGEADQAPVSEASKAGSMELGSISSAPTPGPWKAGRTDMTTLTDRDPEAWGKQVYSDDPRGPFHHVDGKKLPLVVAQALGCTAAEAHANARLIAAAPLMADALRCTKRWLPTAQWWPELSSKVEVALEALGEQVPAATEQGSVELGSRVTWDIQGTRFDGFVERVEGKRCFVTESSDSCEPGRKWELQQSEVRLKQTGSILKIRPKPRPDEGNTADPLSTFALERLWAAEGHVAGSTTRSLFATIADLQADVDRLRSFESGWREIETALRRSEEERASVDLVHHVPSMQGTIASLQAKVAELETERDAAVIQAEAMTAERDELAKLADSQGDETWESLKQTATCIERIKALELERDDARSDAESTRAHFDTLGAELALARAQLKEVKLNEVESRAKDTVVFRVPLSVGPSEDSARATIRVELEDVIRSVVTGRLGTVQEIGEERIEVRADGSGDAAGFQSYPIEELIFVARPNPKRWPHLPVELPGKDVESIANGEVKP